MLDTAAGVEKPHLASVREQVGDVAVLAVDALDDDEDPPVLKNTTTVCSAPGTMSTQVQTVHTSAQPTRDQASSEVDCTRAKSAS